MKIKDTYSTVVKIYSQLKSIVMHVEPIKYSRSTCKFTAPAAKFQ